MTIILKSTSFHSPRNLPHGASRVTQKPPGFFSTPKKTRFPNNGMPPKREEVQVGDEKWKAGSWNLGILGQEVP